MDQRGSYPRLRREPRYSSSSMDQRRRRRLTQFHRRPRLDAWSVISWEAQEDELRGRPDSHFSS